MTDDFVPAPSFDSHTLPMEVKVPLLDSSSDLEPANDNTTIKSVIYRPDRLPTVQKIGTDYDKPSDQSVVRSSHETQTMSQKMFPVADLKTIPFYQALISEFLGTMLLTLIATSTGLPIASKFVPGLHGALASGFMVSTIIVGFGRTSGAHINPAVTIAFLVALEIDVFRAVFYIVMQVLGAVSASILVSSLAPTHAHGTLGMTTITAGISLTQAFIVEFIITFILIYTVHAICDKERDDVGGSKSLAVGVAVVIGCLFGGPYTGGSMNPARSFGPAMVMNVWEHHWIYWLGPITGAIVATLVYTRVLKAPKPPLVDSDTRLRLNADKLNHI